MAINKLITTQQGVGQVFRETQKLKAENDSFLYINLDILKLEDVQVNGETAKLVQKFVRESNLSMGILIDSDKLETEVSIRKIVTLIEYYAHSANLTVRSPKWEFNSGLDTETKNIKGE